mgnify:CR=1 FL=1
MKSYLSLVPISAKVHKRQSRMTRICIILAVFLVTSIFSMVEMWTKSGNHSYAPQSRRLAYSSAKYTG